MTDKKLTDKDIVKGLKRCISTTTDEACAGCPFNKQNLCNKDQLALEKYALDLIKRQKAEIERLKSELSNMSEIEIEAYKKFAKKLKKRYDNPVWYLGGSNGFFDNLDSFVKEMVGEEE